MKESELKTLIGGVVADELESKLPAALTDNIKAEVAKVADDYTKTGEFKERLQDTLSQMKPDAQSKEEQEAQKEMEGKFKSGGEFLNAIYRTRHFGDLDPRLRYLDSNGKVCRPNLSKDAQFKAPGGTTEGKVNIKTMEESTDSSGGFLVPTEFMPNLMQLRLEQSVVRNYGRPMVLPMNTDKLEIPRIHETSHASNLYGGVAGGWTAEGGTMSSSEPKFGNVTLEAKEYSGYTVATNALLQDNAVALESVITRLFGEAWGYYEDDAFLEGTGSGQPLGVTNADALVTVFRQNANHFYFLDVPNIWARVLPRSRDNGIFIMNHEVEADLIPLVVENTEAAATKGNVIFISPDRGAADSPPSTIMGRPYYVTEKVPGLGSASDFGFYDFSQYLIGDRQSLTIDASTHVYFTTNKTAWRFVFRVDGQPWMQSAITPKNGSNTLSPFVSLAATAS